MAGICKTGGYINVTRYNKARTMCKILWFYDFSKCQNKYFIIWCCYCELSCYNVWFRHEPVDECLRCKIIEKSLASTIVFWYFRALLMSFSMFRIHRYEISKVSLKSSKSCGDYPPHLLQAPIHPNIVPLGCNRTNSLVVSSWWCPVVGEKQWLSRRYETTD